MGRRGGGSAAGLPTTTSITQPVCADESLRRRPSEPATRAWIRSSLTLLRARIASKSALKLRRNVCACLSSRTFASVSPAPPRAKQASRLARACVDTASRSSRRVQ